MPRCSGEHAWQPVQRVGEDCLVWGGARQVKPDLSLQHLDPGGELDQAQTQGIELGDAPDGAPRHGGPQVPHQPVGTEVQEQPHLVGGSAVAGGAIGGEMRLPCLVMVLGLAAGAVDVLIDGAATHASEADDDEAGVDALQSGLDAGDDALDAIPACGAIVEFLEPAALFATRPGGTCGRGGLERGDVPAQRGGRCNAKPELDSGQRTDGERLGVSH